MLINTIKKNSLLSICSSWYCLHMLVSCAFGRSGQVQVWWLISECLSFSCISFSRSLISFFVCKMHSRQKSLFISVTTKCLRIESSFFRRRSFSSLLLSWPEGNKLKRQNGSWSDKQLCIPRSCSFFRVRTGPCYSFGVSWKLQSHKWIFPSVS